LLQINNKLKIQRNNKIKKPNIGANKSCPILTNKKDKPLKIWVMVIQQTYPKTSRT
jgi:hypothetical protein